MAEIAGYRRVGVDRPRAGSAGRTLAKAPRISADTEAVRRAEPLMTYTGRIKGLLVNVDNDDPVDPASDELGCFDTLRGARTAGKFRLI